MAGQVGKPLARRTRRRVKRAGGSVAGVDLSDGVTRQEARRAKRAVGGTTKPKPKSKPKGTSIADRLANLEYGRAEGLLNDEIRREGAHEKTIGQAFDDYNRRVDELVKASSDAAAAAGAEYGQLAGQSATAVAGLNSQAQAAIQERANVLGFDAGAATHAESGAQQGAAFAAQQAARQGEAIARSGSGATTDLARMGAIGARDKVTHLESSRKRVQKIEGDKRNLQREKANYRTKIRDEQQQRAQEQYIAILGLRQEALSEKADRRLRRELGLLDRQTALDQIASDEAMNDADNATELAKGQQGAGGKGGKGKKGLSPSQRREWNQTKAKYQAGAARMRKNLKRFKDRDSAWHQTAQDLGGDLSRADMIAFWWIAKGGKIPADVKKYLQSKFPGGKSPWG